MGGFEGCSAVARPDGAALVTLERGGHVWIVRCAPADEPVLKKTLASWARRADCSFRPFDEALVLRRFRNRLTPGLNKPDSAA